MISPEERAIEKRDVDGTYWSSTMRFCDSERRLISTAPRMALGLSQLLAWLFYVQVLMAFTPLLPKPALDGAVLNAC
jgi:membrane-associated protease RseP (regulator of RpoE activity)